jgi:hypothetical protein
MLKTVLRGLNVNLYANVLAAPPSPFWKNTLEAPMIATMLGRKEIIRKKIPNLPLNGYFKKMYIL